MHHVSHSLNRGFTYTMVATALVTVGIFAAAALVNNKQPMPTATGVAMFSFILPVIMMIGISLAVLWLVTGFIMNSFKKF